MKGAHWVLVGVLLTLAVSWTFLLSKRQVLEAEVVELEERNAKKPLKQSSRKIRLMRVTDIHLTEADKDVMRGNRVLPKVEILSHLGNNDLKSLAAELIALTQKGKL